MVKNVIFDFGGVLINDRSDDQELKALIASLPESLQQKHKNTLLQSELGQIPYNDVLVSDKEILFPEKTLEEIADYFLNTEVYDTFQLAERLRDRYNVIIFSNNHAGATEKVAKYLNMDISKFPFINSALVGCANQI